MLCIFTHFFFLNRLDKGSSTLLDVSEPDPAFVSDVPDCCPISGVFGRKRERQTHPADRPESQVWRPRPVGPLGRGDHGPPRLKSPRRPAARGSVRTGSDPHGRRGVSTRPRSAGTSGPALDCVGRQPCSSHGDSGLSRVLGVRGQTKGGADGGGQTQRRAAVTFPATLGKRVAPRHRIPWNAVSPGRRL